MTIYQRRARALTEIDIAQFYEEIVVTLEFVSELHSLSVPWNRYLKCCTYGWQCSPLVKDVVLCSLRLRCSKNLKTEWKSVASSVAFAASRNFLADTWSTIPTDRTYLKRGGVSTYANRRFADRSGDLTITLTRARYGPSTRVLRLSPHAHCRASSACPRPIDEQPGTGFPKTTAGRPEASSRRLRGIAITDAADNTPFGVPASWWPTRASNVARVFHAQLRIYEIRWSFINQRLFHSNTENIYSLWELTYLMYSSKTQMTIFGSIASSGNLDNMWLYMSLWSSNSLYLKFSAIVVTFFTLFCSGVPICDGKRIHEKGV